jgi:hypothetical protein
MRRTRVFLASLFASALVFAAVPGSASAQPVVTGGLINVTIVDLVDLSLEEVNVGVGVAANLAANVCPALDLNAAVLAEQIVREGDTIADCETATQELIFAPVQRTGG